MNTTSVDQRQSSALRRRCEQIAVDLSAYVDGELEAEEFTRPRCRVEAHLEACGDCRALARDWGAVVDVLAVPDVPERPWFAAEFRRRLESEESVRRDPFGWIGWRLIPVAVTILGLSLGVWVRVELDRDRISETLVERILRIQDLETATLASTPVIADHERPGGAFDLDELLLSSGGAGAESEDRSGVGEEADSATFARRDKDR